MMLFFRLLFLSLLAPFVKASGGDAWHQDVMYALVNEELDPIVSPNAQSSHMHKVLGGSNFAAYYNQDDYESASCTSGAVQADKSNYWKPSLYFVDPSTKKYVPLDARARFYYFMYRDSDLEPTKPFPKGLRMLAGNPNNKSPTSVAAFQCHPNADLTDPIDADNFNFNNSCKAGLKTTVYFPSCWDGINLYKSDGSHMAYPGVRCPLSHPNRIINIHLEYTWYPGDYNYAGVNLAGNLIWANGDTTGYGIHADFVNGWDMDVLQRALNDTTCISNSGNAMSIQGCPVLAESYSESAAAACNSPSKGYLAEAGNTDLTPIDALPGCNLPWGATGSKPTCSPAVAGLDVSALTGTDGSYTADVSQAFTLPTTPGWQTIACVTGSPAIQNYVSYTDNSITDASCQANCAKEGYSFAATGLVGTTWNCYCGSSLDMSTERYPGMCTTACPGNSTATCGGSSSYIFQLYYAPPGTPVSDSVTTSYGANYVGCYNDASDGLLSVAAYSFKSGSMTTEICLDACLGKDYVWAATSSSAACYCGNDWTFGSGSFVQDSACTTKCGGNSSEICGDYYRSSVYNLTNAELTNSSVYHPSGWLGCYQDSSRTAIPAGFSWSVSTNTPQLCIDGCSQLNYTYAGIEQGSYCYCGNSFHGGQELPVSQCSTSCSGNSSAVCGGTSSMDLYKTTSATNTVASQQAARPAGYLGCFVDSGSSTTLTNYSYTSASMTVELCKQACSGFGYAYAGVENGNGCKCGSSAPSTQQWPATMKCTTACAGNSSEICGASGYLEAYSTSATSFSSNSTNSSTSSSDYYGCYSDSTKGLTSYSFSYASMTTDICRTSCLELGYAMAAIDGGTTCYCGTAWTGAQALPESSCTTACPGNANQTCGGKAIASVWYTKNAAAITGKPTGWLGCYTDSSSRTLTGYTYSSSSMTAAVCQTACSKAGYSLAGTESSGQCYCGNSTANGGARSPSLFCTSVCTGDANQTCGGSYRLDLYNATALSTTTGGSSTYQGCYNDYSVLNGYSYSSDWMSTDICRSACYALGYAYSGNRNGGQCYCGNTAPSKVAANSACVSPCTANATQNCGTASYAAVYSTSGLTTGDIVLSPNATGYIGCFTDASTRVLPYSAFGSSSLTNQMCATNCATLGYALSGTEGSSCFCGNKPNSTAPSTYHQVADADCTTVCPGGGSMCGANWKMSIYDTSLASSNATTATPEGYQGCFLPGTMVSSPAFTYNQGYMTVGICRRTCRAKGYSIASLSGGNLCDCSSSVQYGAVAAPAACGAPCQGNTTENCGGSSYSAVSIYDTTGVGSVGNSSYPANYVGCWPDNPAALANYSYSSSGMTSALCKAACAAKGYSVYGTRSSTCECANTLPSTYVLPDAQCNIACPGLSSEYCGGSSRISVYSTTYSQNVSSTSSSVTPSNTSSVSSRVNATSSSTSAIATASANQTTAASSVSANKTDTATSTSYLSSTNVSSTSRSTTLVSSSSVATSTASVDRTAVTNTTASASKTSALTSSAIATSVKSSGSTSAGVTVTSSMTTTSSATAVSSATSRAVSSASLVSTVSDPITQTNSSTARSTSSSSSSSVGTVTSTVTRTPSVSSVTASSTSVAPSGASMSSSDSSRVAGTVPTLAATSSVTLSKASTVTVSSTTSASASSSTHSLTSTSAIAPSASATSDATYVGCYTQATQVITNANMTCDSLTPSMCKVWCNANGYTYAGMKQGNYCGCTNDISALTSVASTQCSTACIGDSSADCGGNSAFSLYKASATLSKIRRKQTVPYRHKRRNL